MFKGYLDSRTQSEIIDNIVTNPSRIGSPQEPELGAEAIKVMRLSIFADESTKLASLCLEDSAYIIDALDIIIMLIIELKHLVD